MRRKYIGYFILLSSMLVLTLVFSTNSYSAMSPGSNVRGGITIPPEINKDDLNEGNSSIQRAA